MKTFNVSSRFRKRMCFFQCMRVKKVVFCTTSFLNKISWNECLNKIQFFRSSVEETKQMEAKVAALAKDKARAEHKLNQLNAKLAKLTTELKDERHMNESLRQNQMSWQVKMTELEKKFVQKDAEVQELQVRQVLNCEISTIEFDRELANGCDHNY